MLLRQLGYALTLVSITPLGGLPYCQAQEKPSAPSISELRIQGLKGLERRDGIVASDAADRLLLHYPKDARAIRLAGDLYLRSGKIHSSIKQFERYIELAPADKAELWQYGIALALAGRYEDGRKVFELHRTINPNDVENAAWHFLCVAKKSGIKEAKKSVLPAPNDSRRPMEEIHRLLVDGNEERVLVAINALPTDSAAHSEASFYGNLYLGLFADALNNPTKAKRLMAEAAEMDQVNYMADIARVYLIELEARN